MKHIAAAACAAALLAASAPASAAEFVSVAASFNSELGCPGDWQPECPAAQMAKAADGLWYAQFDLPTGDYEFKIAYNKSWDENYGVDGILSGANLSLSVGVPGQTVYFRHDEATKLTSFQFDSFQAGVPEPATWAMMLGGFGVIGAAARCRKILLLVRA